MSDTRVSRRRAFPPLTELRAFRLTHRVRLVDTARLAGMSAASASLLERFPATGSPEDEERLRQGVLRASPPENPDLEP